MFVTIIAQVLHYLFFSYTILIFIRIVGSWFPRLAQHRFMNVAAAFTDPYLNIFRRFIPPIGGMLDLSPILGFFALEILERVLLASMQALLT